MIPAGDRPHHDYGYTKPPELEPPDPEVFTMMTPRELAEHEARNIDNLPVGPSEASVRIWSDPDRRTVTFTLDPPTAALMMFAARVLMADYWAHEREVRLYGQTLAEGTWGRTNREKIADRLGRHAQRLAAVDKAYRREVDTEYWGY